MSELPNITLSIDRAVGHAFNTIDVNLPLLENRFNVPDVTFASSLHIHLSALSIYDNLRQETVRGIFCRPSGEYKIPPDYIDEYLSKVHAPDIIIFLGSAIHRARNIANPHDRDEKVAESINETLDHEIEHYLQNQRGEIAPREEMIKANSDALVKIMKPKFEKSLGRFFMTIYYTAAVRYIADPLLKVDLNLLGQAGVGYTLTRLLDAYRDRKKIAKGEHTIDQKILQAAEEAHNDYLELEHEKGARESSVDASPIVKMNIREDLNTDLHVPTYSYGSLGSTALSKVMKFSHRTLALRPR